MASLGDQGSKKETITGHFRVRRNVYKALEEKAKERKVSMNTLVNQVLSNYTDDQVLFDEIGSVRMSKDAYRAHLSVVPDDKMADLGRILAKTSPRGIMLQRRGVADLEAVLDFLRLQSRFGLWSLSETKRGGKSVITVIHDLGPKESALLAAYLPSLFAIAGIKGKLTVTDSTVLIEF
jgi:hypothetical protein